jgi:branched-chain amino acid transport system ATP-binding protein
VSKTLLHAEIASSSYGAAEVLRDVDIDVGEGEIVTVVGSNGAGKTTLLRTISGVLVKASAVITLDGEDVSKRSPATRVQAGIVHVPEGRRVFADLSVKENLEVAARARKLNAEELEKGFEQVFRLFPVLSDRGGLRATSLSGGEQQMLAIARGLMSRPKVLMVDEASLGLAPMLVVNVFGVLSRLRSEGLAILLVEQNARASLEIADRGYVLERGAVRLSGSASSLLKDERVASTYLGGHLESGRNGGTKRGGKHAKTRT